MKSAPLRSLMDGPRPTRPPDFLSRTHTYWAFQGLFHLPPHHQGHQQVIVNCIIHHSHSSSMAAGVAHQRDFRTLIVVTCFILRPSF